MALANIGCPLQLLIFLLLVLVKQQKYISFPLLLVLVRQQQGLLLFLLLVLVWKKQGLLVLAVLNPYHAWILECIWIIW